MQWVRWLLIVLTLVTSATMTSPTSYATPSPHLVLSHIQAGGVGDVTREFVALYNNSDNSIDVTGWCIQNGSGAMIGCIDGSVSLRAMVEVHGYVTIASASFSAQFNYQPDVVLRTLNQSSGSIATGTDKIGIIDSVGVLVDEFGWSSSLSAGSVWQRQTVPGQPLQKLDTDLGTDFIKAASWTIPQSGVYEQEIVVDVCDNLAGLQTGLPVGYLYDETGSCQIDSCLNLAGLQLSIPDGMTANEAGACTMYDACLNLDGIQSAVPEGATQSVAGDCVTPLVPLVITELLPNVSGSDIGNEYIELYNPSSQRVELGRYLLKIGMNADKTYSFPSGLSIDGGRYLAVSNSILPFTLVNTSSKVTLTGLDESIVSETAAYTEPKDDMAWALIDGVWLYTNQPTPNDANHASEESSEIEAVAVVPTPCSTGKYRSEETGRCRNIPVESVLAACKLGQYRSEETNRCRNLVAASILKPCRDDQYRSEETNRCRNIATAVSQLTPCKEGQERSEETNRCRNAVKTVPAAAFAIQPVKDGAKTFVGWWALGGVTLLALGYAGWEWRREVVAAVQKMGSFLTRGK